MDDRIPGLLAEKLSWFLDSTSAIEIRVAVNSTNHLDGVNGRGIHCYIQTSKGERKYERVWPDLKPDQTERKVDYFDGARGAEASWRRDRQLNVIYKHSFANESSTALGWRPDPLSYLYLQHQPLSVALRSAIHIGSETRLGRPCEVLLIPGVKWTYSSVDLIYSLDRETGLPLEVKCFEAGADHSRAIAQWTWKALKFEKVDQNRYWPVHSVSEVFVRDANGAGKPLRTVQHVVEIIKFDQSYPSGTFRPSEEPGAHILDTITNKNWVVPGVPKGAMTRSDSTSVRQASHQATPPGSWFTMFPSISLILGVLLVASGLLAKYLRRRTLARR